MKAFWITISATATLLIVWGIFISFVSVDVENMVSSIDMAIVSVEEEDWEDVQKNITLVSERWYSSRLMYSLFFDAISIGEVEASLVAAEAYSRAQEIGSSLAELSNLRHLILFLYENEMISIENIL